MRKLFILSVLAVISTCVAAQKPAEKKDWVDRILKKMETTNPYNSTPYYDKDLGKVISDQSGKNPVDKVTVPRVAFAETYRSAGTKSPSSVRHTVIFDSRGTSHLITTVRL